MIKQISITLATLASFATFADEINQIQAIEAKIAHIQQEKNSIKQDLEHTIAVSIKAMNVAEQFFKDQYKPLMTNMATIIEKITQSNEFITALIQVTNFQTECIVDKNMQWLNIDYKMTKNPLADLVTNVLKKALPAINQHVEQLFNIFYITVATSRGAELLLTKLAIIENELKIELKILKANSSIK